MSDGDIGLPGTRYRAGEKWYECHLCNHVAPASQMGLINGKPYCYRYDCYPEKLDEVRRNRKAKKA